MNMTGRDTHTQYLEEVNSAAPKKISWRGQSPTRLRGGGGGGDDGDAEDSDVHDHEEWQANAGQ